MLLMFSVSRQGRLNFLFVLSFGQTVSSELSGEVDRT